MATRTTIASASPTPPQVARVVERPDEVDLLTIECEAEHESTSAVVEARLQTALGLKPQVLVRPPRTLPTAEFKSRRILDRRT